MGHALQMMGRPEFDRTIEFVMFFDKFFDCLNVSNFVAGKHSRKSFKAPFHSEKDFRVRVSSVYMPIMHY